MLIRNSDSDGIVYLGYHGDNLIACNILVQIRTQIVTCEINAYLQSCSCVLVITNKFCNELAAAAFV